MNQEQHRFAAALAAHSACAVLLFCLGCSESRHPGQQAEHYSQPVSSMESSVVLDDDANGGRQPGAGKYLESEPATVMDVSTSQPSSPTPERRGFSRYSRAIDAEESAVESDAIGMPAPLRTPLAQQNAGIRESLAGIAADIPQRPAISFELQPGEELWVIAAAEDRVEAQPKNTDPATPGCGALMARTEDDKQLIPVPLKHTDVRGTIDGYIASVNVKQQFQNPFASKIEAVYMFPLPQQAAVNEFIMTVGERRIRGIIRERKEAEKIYAQARSQGHVASLMTQERPNIFTQKVANIEPGKQIDIDIRYFHTLRWDDGEYEFVFPMVIGPRFNPAGSSDPIAAVPRGGSAHTQQSTAVEYLAPDERSGHDISLAVDIRAGVAVEHIHSVNHNVTTTGSETNHQQVTLSATDSIPNKDFVLRYRVAGDTVKSALMTHRDEHGQYFTMMLYPPAELASLQRSPMEMVFVLDCSGSMNGQPLAQSQAAVRQALKMLTPRDSFQMIRFSSNASQLGSQPLPATEQNIQRALTWLSSLNGGGGTQMIEGIKAALDFPHDEGRFRLVTFLTDGYIGNEQQILTTLHQKLGASRVFSFGVGQSPNRYLMDRMALVGRGAVTYLSLNDDAAQVMNGFAERISHPALTDVSIDWGDMQVTDVYPSRLPDLVVGRPVVLSGRFTGEPSTVRVGGLACMQPVDYEVSVTDDQQPHPAIAAVWARHRIADLMSQATQSPDLLPQIKQTVLQTALNYNLMSSWTAFIAVDSLTKTAGEFGTTVAVPLPVPEGVRYETTVGPDGDL